MVNSRAVWTVGLMLAMAGAMLAADKDKDKDKKRKIDPQLSVQLARLFDQLDRDKDAFLDKTELAKAFRGNNARPAPDVPPINESDKKPARPGFNPTQYPDLVFLLAYDDDDDNKISYAEFEDAGVDYNESLKKAASELKKAQEQALKQLTQSRRQGAGARRPAGRSSFGNLMNQYGRK
jgi:hypothetical protein